MEKPYGGSTASSFGDENYPWPNESTSVEGSDQISSKVTFADFDQNTFEDAAFVSSSFAGEQVMIRIVRSISFTEQFNIMSLPSRPDPLTKMLFVDLDAMGGDKELIYLSEDRTQVVGVDLSGTPGSIRFNLRVVEPIDREQEIDFSIERLAAGNAIEIAGNLIYFGRNQTPNIVSGTTPVDGAWGDWGNWFQFSNGTPCSKVCGNGFEIRNRVCNNPAPRNGGNQCEMQTAEQVCRQPTIAAGGANCLQATQVPLQKLGAIHTKTCRLRDCVASECALNEMFVSGSCESDPNAPSDPNQPIRPGDPYTPPEPGDPNEPGGGVEQPSDCTSGEVFDPYFYRCFKAYPISNIFLTYRERVYRSRDDGYDGPDYINHTHRISLNHSRTVSMTAQTVAREFCRFRGHFDVVSWTTGHYIAGSGGDNAVFLLCNPAVNGMYQGCPIGNNYVRWDYRGITHSTGSQVQYLKSVICRKQP